MAVDYEALRTHLAYAHAAAHDDTIPDGDEKALAVAGHMVGCHTALAEKSPFKLVGDDDGDEDDMKANKSDFRDEVLALTGVSDEAKALGALTALKEKAEQVEALTARVAELEAAQKDAELSALLERVKPAKREKVKQLAEKFGIECARAFVEELPVKPEPAQPPVETAAPSPVALAGLDADKLKMLSQIGLSPEKFAEHRAVYRAALVERGLRTLNEEK